MKTKSNINWVTDRLSKSPLVTSIVAGSAVLGFLLSLANGSWAIYKEIEAHQKSPTIKIVNQDLVPLKAQISAGLIFGTLTQPFDPSPLPSGSQAHGKKNSFVYDNVSTYYYKIGLAALNPRNEASSIFECKLDIEFDKKHLVSRMYFHEGEILNEESPSPAPILHLAPKEVRKVNFLFFFLTDSEAEKVFSTRRQADSFFIICRDQDGGVLTARRPLQ